MFSSVFKKIIPDATTPTCQEVGGVTQPLIFCRRHRFSHGIALTITKDYCTKWKLTVNSEKSKIIIFRKGGQLPRNLKFYFNDIELSIVESFCYLGVVFYPGGSYSSARSRLVGQAKKPYLG